MCCCCFSFFFFLLIVWSFIPFILAASAFVTATQRGLRGTGTSRIKKKIVVEITLMLWNRVSTQSLARIQSFPCPVSAQHQKFPFPVKIKAFRTRFLAGTPKTFFWKGDLCKRISAFNDPRHAFHLPRTPHAGRSFYEFIKAPLLLSDNVRRGMPKTDKSGREQEMRF